MSHDLENEFADLARALREARPTPEPEFIESLDRAVADHFPPEWAEEAAVGRRGSGRVGSWAERLRRRVHGNRILLPALAGVAGVLFVAAVAVNTFDSKQFGSGDGGSDVPTTMADKAGSSATYDSAGGKAGETLGSFPRAQTQSSPEFQSNSSAAMADSAVRKSLTQLRPGSRDVAREAEITLGTDPSGVQDVANEVVSVTDDHKGIVMNSKVTDGEEGEAGATFKLLIPSGEIESAVADLSEIADLRARSQELVDITAPTNDAEDDIADSKARIKSLLGELEVTYDETERQDLERRIRWERYDLRAAKTRLNRLERRADYTPVSLSVETGADTVSDDESSWGVSDAVDDAGRLLGVAAGVTLVALAVAIPIGIVILIVLAMNRAWVRHSRRRALGDD
ncbi:MAG: DUF4349 domain-containing protein [Solirubrobacterales bacterium]|nr:DUF4349 domain-containing protein [Solirubrobacterales bacterium]